MENKTISILHFAVLALVLILWSCDSNTEEVEFKDEASSRNGMKAVAIVSLGNSSDLDTRSTVNTQDGWGVGAFSIGDEVGLYSISGLENPDNNDLFNQPAKNKIMYFEGMTGSNYRFGNSDFLIDPSTLGGSSHYSLMYYPYYEDMPETYVSSGDYKPQGMWIRKTDDIDGIEKCIDIMATYGNVQYGKGTDNSYSSVNSYTYGSSYLSLSNGLLAPTFYHICSTIAIIRGNGFKEAEDRRIWVVMQNPVTDFRIRQSSSTGVFYPAFQYHPKDNEEEMVKIIEESKFEVNKYRVWQAWQGANYGGNETFYAVVPPGTASFIFLQDDNGVWQNAGDFYLYSSTSKIANTGYRFYVTITLEGLNPVVRPVLIEDWNNGGEITDQLEVGINNYNEYLDWLRVYNLYTQSRNPALEEQLKSYGVGVYDPISDYTSWTFYINSDIVLPNKPEYTITKLDDTLKGVSVYTNIKISNLQVPLVEEMGEKGVLEAFEFYDLYIVDTEENGKSYTGGLVSSIKNGRINNCKVINGIIVSDKSSGMLAGEIVGGKITNTTVSGQVIGSSTSPDYMGWFGVNSGNIIFEDNYSAELYFETFN